MRFLGSGRSGTFEWLFQRVSGVALVLLLGFHFILIHFTGDPGPVTYDKVAPRLASPLYKAWELLFLVLALYHAMTGLKLVLDDYVHNHNARIWLNGLVWVAALALLIFGSLTIITFSYQPGA